MILTVTMNPSIDMAYDLSSLQLNKVNRAIAVHKTAGGKGLNVTRVIGQMNQPVMATGILGGRFGEYISDKLAEEKIESQFTNTAGETRNSIALLHDGNLQTEILEKGPIITEEEQKIFLENFNYLLGKVNLVTISGSLPKGTKANFYAELIKAAAKKHVDVILDTSGQSLVDAINGKQLPLLIKPNAAELGILIHQEVTDHDTEKVIKALKTKIFSRLTWVSTSLGSNGAIVKCRDVLYRAEIPKVKAINPVGSGDASLAGLAIGITLGKSPSDIIKTSMALGILNALEPETGKINANNFKKYFDLVKVYRIN